MLQLLIDGFSFLSVLLTLVDTIARRFSILSFEGYPDEMAVRPSSPYQHAEGALQYQNRQGRDLASQQPTTHNQLER